MGPFHKSFSAVVGPNGSGKSNVIDALQFVFGKRAAKIRFKKLADLIHNSSQHSNLQKARVTVAFSYIVDEEDGGLTEVPDSGFTVERTVNRSGVCNYYLDGNSSNWGEVTCVLKAQGIDLDHNRFLILQGEVEQISLMKPKGGSAHEEGLLEYLEDIIGSNQYVEPIAKAAADLEAAVLEHDAALERTHFAEHELKKLRTLKEEAEAHFQALMELCDKRALLIRLEQAEAEARTAETRATELALQQRLEHNGALLEDKEGQLRDMAARYAEDKEAFQSAQKQQEEAKAALQEFERQDVKLTEELKHGTENVRKMEAKIKKYKKELKEKEELKKLESKVPKLEKKLEQATALKEAEEQKLEAMYEELKGESTKIHIALEKKQQEMLPWTKSINESQSALELAESELAMADKARAERVAALSRAEEELDRLREQIAQTEEELREARGLSEGGEQRVAQAEDRQREWEAKEEEARQRLRDVRERLETSKSERADTR